MRDCENIKTNFWFNPFHRSLIGGNFKLQFLLLGHYVLFFINMIFYLCVGREVPVLEVYPSTPQTITEGSPTLLQCRVMAGIPHPEITWSRKDGQPLSSNVNQPYPGVLR